MRRHLAEWLGDHLIRSGHLKRHGKQNEALDIFVYTHAALHGLICMGLRLNEEVEKKRRNQYAQT